MFSFAWWCASVVGVVFVFAGVQKILAGPDWLVQARKLGAPIWVIPSVRWVELVLGCLLVADVVADAFCYSMVRNLVGAVVCVADGRKDPSWMAELLANKERVSDSLVFPARGLSLYRVDYPTNDQLIERAKVTIGKRDGSD